MPNYKKVALKIAQSRISYLLELSDEIFSDSKALANRYVDLATKYAQRVRIRLPKKWKKRICRNCGRFLMPGINCRVRLQSRKGKGTHISITCLECNHVSRYFIKTSPSE
jgi:ribonuclease P protein subunit RPR2